MNRYVYLIILLILLPAFLVVSQDFNGEIQGKPGPGSYNRNINLSLDSPLENSEIYYSFSDKNHFILYDSPLHLSAVKGEERRYRIVLRLIENDTVVSEKEVEYRIDKREPLPPELSLIEGTYYREIELHFTGPDSDFIRYAVNPDLESYGKVWEGESIKLACEPGSIRNYQITALACDKAGNQTSLISRHYTIDRKEDSVENEVPIIKSPVQGVFSNKQYFFIENADSIPILYSLDGSNPEETGHEYKSPFLIDKTGKVTVRVLAFPGNPQKRREYVISYQCLDETVKGIESGYMYSSFSIDSAILPEARYTFSERSPLAKDPIIGERIDFPVVKGLIRTKSIRFQSFKEESKDSAEFRYFFVLDGREIKAPSVQIFGTEPLNSKSRIYLSAPRGTYILYSIDGSEPSLRHYSNKEAISLDLENNKEGEIVLEARSIYPGAKESSKIKRVFHYDTIAPNKPIHKLIPDNEKKSIQLEIENPEDNRIVYEMTQGGGVTKDPDIDSPLLPSPLVITVPYGMEETFSISLASIDKAGNISLSGEKSRFTIDRRPPPVPKIFIDKNTMRIEGKGDIFYSVQSATMIDAFTDNYQPYTKPELLPKVPGESIRYVISAYARDEEGNTSQLAGPVSHEIDDRIPKLPAYSGLRDGERYADSVSLRFFSTDDDLRIYYTIDTSDKDPPDPSRDDPWTKNEISFKGEEGEEIRYSIKLLPVYTSRDIAGNSTLLNFTIDKKDPELPVIRGIENGEVYHTNVDISIESQDQDDSVYFTLWENGEEAPEPFGKHSVLYTKPFSLSSDDRRGFNLLVGVEDQAGNRSIYDQAISFIINPNVPPPPQFEISGEGIIDKGKGFLISNKPVDIKIASEEDTVYYSITESPLRPAVPNRNSPQYQGSILLEGEEGKEIVYSILSIAYDSEGNRGKPSSLFKIFIDRLKPPEPPSPNILIKKDIDRKIIKTAVIWDIPGDFDLHYRLDSGTGKSKSFTEYNGPVNIDLEHNSLRISYYLADQANNRSNVKEEVLSVSDIPPKPSFSGIRSGGVYNTGQKLINTSSHDVHFEITEKKKANIDVTKDSPLMGNEVLLDSLEGETVTYYIHARTFSNNFASEVAVTSLTIDKTHPEAPKILIISDEDKEQEKISVSVPEGTAYIRIAPEQFGNLSSITFSRDSFQEYRNEIPLSSLAWDSAVYSVSAFTEDRAGNRSKIVSEIIYNESQLIFVSSMENNTVTELGSKEDPFTSLSAALSQAQKQGKGTLILSEGEFFVNSTQDLEGIEIHGGFSRETWEETKNHLATVIQISGKDDFWASVTEGRTSIRNLSMVHNANSYNKLIVNRGGELILEDVRIINSDNKYVIFQEDGETSLNACRIESSFAENLEQLKLVSGELVINSSRFQARETLEKAVLVSARDAKITIQSSSFFPGNGNSIIGLSFNNCEADIRSSIISSGSANYQTNAFVCKESDVVIQKCKINGEAGSHINSLIQSEISSIELLDSELLVDGDFGAQGLYAKDSNIILSHNSINNGRPSDFLYTFNLKNSASIFSTNMISSTRSDGDYICAIIENGQSRWIQNSVSWGKGKNTTQLLRMENARLNLTNNIFLTSFQGQGSFLYVGNPKDLVISHNALAGWKSLILEGESNIDQKPSFEKVESRFAGDFDHRVQLLNSKDGDPLSGPISGNISVSTEKDLIIDDGGIFLSGGSNLIDAGKDLSEELGTSVDIQGEKRPYPGSPGAEPRYDIGADEFH